VIWLFLKERKKHAEHGFQVIAPDKEQAVLQK
jgi:hypothetical protein